MSSKKKYYVVWTGRKTGIFRTWDECKAQVDGFAQARYQSFESLDTAEAAFRNGAAQIHRPALSLLPTPSAVPPIVPSLSVDAACSGNPGLMEYRGVDTASRKQLFHFGPLPRGTNNIGEFLAIIHGLAYLKKHNLPHIPIYSDSRNAIKWVQDKEVRTQLGRDLSTEKIFELIDRALVWLQQNTYTNPVLKWDTDNWGENPADFGRK